MSSVLTSEKRNVSFSLFICIASMLGWSLYLKIALRVGSVMFSVSGSNSLYIEIIRVFTVFENKFYLEFQWFLIQFLKLHPFQLH